MESEIASGARGRGREEESSMERAKRQSWHFPKACTKVRNPPEGEESRKGKKGIFTTETPQGSPRAGEKERKRRSIGLQLAHRGTLEDATPGRTSQWHVRSKLGSHSITAYAKDG